MRIQIPPPMVALIIAAVILVLGLVLWQGTSPGRDAEKTEERLRRAFGGGGKRVAPMPPAGSEKTTGSPPLTLPGR
ncbi:MAG TPA: hypothetical protein VNJ09_06570 [Chthonomonadales bacterium]|nr:hypothetical protein [Chthonomonadales bacterium]